MMEIIKIRKSDDAYPKQLLNISNPPELLYCIGNTALLREIGIAVVGTRRSSPYGRWAAYEIGKKIADCGVVVVSGMAEGIDSQGHLGCLDAGGKTIAVLGTGIDICFPRSNQSLYKRIAENGLLVSEYPPGERGKPYYFPARNRIISGLCRAVVVVEGAIKSGSMITADLALSQGRDVFAVPGNINQPNSVGVNKLIMDGAAPVLSIDDVPDLLGIDIEISKERAALLSENEQKVYTIVKENPGSVKDYISIKCDTLVSETSAQLSILELKGLIYSENGRYYIT